MSEIVGWFTMNGKHIPIMKGESKAKAAGRFIKNRRAIARNRKTINDIVDEANPALKKYAPAEAKDYKVPTIKGRAKNEFSYTTKEGDEVKVKEIRANGKHGIAVTQHGHTEIYKDNRGINAIRQHALEHAIQGTIIGKAKYGSKYKLKEDRRTLKRMKTAKETASEITKIAKKRLQDAQDRVLDRNYKKISEYNKALKIEQDKARKENDKELGKLEKVIKYQGYVGKNGTSKLKSYKSKDLKETVDRKRGVDEAFKLVYGVGVQDFSQGYSAYKTYLSKHPNSKMRLDTFLKTYKKRK